MNRLSALSLSALSLCMAISCGYTQKKYAREFAEENCILYEDCEVLDVFGWESLDACTSATQESMHPKTSDCAAYDGPTARDCVWGVRQMTCEDLVDMAYPDACNAACDAGADE